MMDLTNLDEIEDLSVDECYHWAVEKFGDNDASKFKG